MPQLPIKDELVTVFGGSGFVGRHVVRALARAGYRVRIAVRRPDLTGFLRPYGAVGQLHSVQANVRDMGSVARAVEGADAAVNLVGILHRRGRQTFDAVHVEGARTVARAAVEAGVGRLVQISAIGADPGSDSLYARSKAAGEAALAEVFPAGVILRPSIVFGPEDHFFNRFAAMASLSPVLPIVGPETRFQPVFVGNVADAVLAGVQGRATPGTVYELGGPEVATFRELMEMMLRVIDRRRLIVPIPFALARLQASFLQLLPNPLLTVDQVRQLMRDNVVSGAAEAEGRTLQGLGIVPSALAPILPSYLYRFRRRGQFHAATEA